jgi:hypothetical protein
LKVFLRTEEKKREKERQSAAATPTPATPVVETPASCEQPSIQVPVEQNRAADIVAQVPNAPKVEGEVEATAAGSDRAPTEDALAESKESDPVQNGGTETVPLVSEV